MTDLDQFAARLQRAPHRELFDYWRSKASPDNLPARRDIDPVEIPMLLPWITLYDVDWAEGRPRFRFRLVGTGIVRRYGRDATGMWFEDAYEGEILERQVAAFSEVATMGRPLADSLSAPISGKEFITSHKLILPLADDGARVDHMVAVILFDDAMPGARL